MALAPDRGVLVPRMPGVVCGHPRLRRTGQLVGVAFAGVALVAGILWVLTPPVDQAEEPAHILVTDHGGRDLDGDGIDAPRKFAAAVVATEDTRFYRHWGIDFLGLPRAAWVALTDSETDPGGSTLDQQLAKQLYFDGAQGGIWTTTEQVILAVKLDTLYSKPQILEMYASVAYFGHGYYGLDAAARGYFGVRPGQVSWAQAAMLAGVLQAPTRDDPLTHLDEARARQHHVLARLVDNGELTAAQADVATAAPLHLAHP